MSPMRNYLFLILLLSSPVFSEEVVLSKIKISLDESLYVWNIGERIPEKDSQGFSHPQAVLSFLDLKPGDSLEQSDLERKVEQASRRLEDSGWFYQIQLHLIPSRREENRFYLVIQLKQGYLKRYMGGPLWGGFGLVHFKGREDSLFLEGGYNRAGAEYNHYPLRFSPLFFTMAGHYHSSLPWEKKEYSYLTSRLSLGVMLHPDWDIKASHRVFWELENPNHETGFSQESSLAFFFQSTPYKENQGRVQSLVQGSLLYLDEFNPRGKIITQLWIPTNPLLLRLQYSLLGESIFSGEIHQESLIDGYLRSGYREGGGRSHSFHGGSFEAAFPMDFPSIQLYPFLFCDLLWLNYQQREEAYGGGMHFYWKAPVFVDLQTFWGNNLQNESVFHIAVSWGDPYQ